MRLSMGNVSLGFVGLVSLAACSVSTTGNSITFKTQPEFTRSTVPAKQSSKAWAGEEITINSNGVNPLIGTGGVTVVVDPTATFITAKADFAARADSEAEAALSIDDAVATFALEEADGRVAISCKNGGKHGSSSAAASGCKRLTVTIPPGTATRPHKLIVGSGMGDLTFQNAPYVSSLLVDSNGVGGVVDVSAMPVKGATITVTGEDDVTVRLPASFSADLVTLTVGEDTTATPSENQARIVTSDFPGLENGKPFGPVGSGAASLNVQTKGTTATPPGLAETVTIRNL